MKYVLTLTFILIFLSSYSQRPDTSIYNNAYLLENFDVPSKVWPEIRDFDNEFMVGDGYYFLKRNNKSIPHAIIMNSNNTVKEFRIVSGIKLSPFGSEEQSIGLIFMVQKSGKDAYIFEINSKKQYRVKFLDNGIYRFLTGEEGSNGWEKEKIINDKGKLNVLEVRLYKNNYYLYVNNLFVISFYNDKFISGSMGLIIGPQSFAKADFYNIYSVNQNEVIVKEEVLTETTSEKSQENTVVKNEDEKTQKEIDKENKKIKKQELKNDKIIEEENIEITDKDIDSLKLIKQEKKIVEKAEKSRKKGKDNSKNLALKDTLDNNINDTIIESQKTEVIKAEETLKNKANEDNILLIKTYQEKIGLLNNQQNTQQNIIDSLKNEIIIKNSIIQAKDSEISQLKVKETKNVKKEIVANASSENATDNEILQREYAKLFVENDSLRMQLMQSNYLVVEETLTQAGNVDVKELEQKYMNTIKILAVRNDSLTQMNEKLRNKKEPITAVKNENNVVNNSIPNNNIKQNDKNIQLLYTTFESEIKKNNELIQKNRVLNDSIITLYNELQNLKLRNLKFELQKNN